MATVDQYHNSRGGNIIIGKTKKKPSMLQNYMQNGVKPLLGAIAHIPAAIFSTPGLKKKK